MSVESYITDCLTKEVGKDLHTYRSEYTNACVRKWVVEDLPRRRKEDLCPSPHAYNQSALPSPHALSV